MNIKKPKLVCVGETFLTRPASHHVPMFEKHFDISDYDTNLTYDKSHNFVYRTDDALESVSKYKNQGSKFIADGLWEKIFWCDDQFDNDTLGLVNNGLFNNERVVQVPKWFWFEEHIGQKARKSKVVVSEENKTNSFLMQVGKEKTERTNLLKKLDALGLLDNAIYSVLFKGKSLEGDIGTYRPETRELDQRNYDPEWYNKTRFTTVVEATWDPLTFVTEKTLKPIMYGHPFIVFGNPLTLSTLQSWGFKTFPQLFNEDYDTEVDTDKRCDMVIQQLKNTAWKETITDCSDSVTHNFNRFWDYELVEKMMYADLIEPILNFLSKSR